MPTHILVSPRAIPAPAFQIRTLERSGLRLAMLALGCVLVYVGTLYPDAFAVMAQVTGP